MSAHDDLVSVVVPAYNAERFLDETLQSIRNQTHRALEIIVVDDGSSDHTADIVRRHASEDPRVQLISQRNLGVGAARNTGLRRATGAYVAPLDADDLWRPEKIERQLTALKSAGPRAGMAYTWFAIIDEHSNVLSKRSKSSSEGNVLTELCVGNIAGNASSALIRTEIVDAIGGYDETLHQRNLQGCEDLKLYWLIAESYEFVCVREFLTGYRVGKGNMSNDFLRMLSSFDVVTSELCNRRPDLTAQFHQGRVSTLWWLTIRALRSGARRATTVLLGELWRYDRPAFFGLLTRLPLHFSRLSLESLFKAVARRAAGAPSRFLPN